MNFEACLSEDTPCVPQRVLQQKKKNVVEAGEESRVRRGVSRPILFWPALAGQMISSVRRTRRKLIYAPAYNKQKQSTGTACVTFVRDRVRDRDRGRDRVDLLVKGERLNFGVVVYYIEDSENPASFLFWGCGRQVNRHNP